MAFEVPRGGRKYLVAKGSVALEGVSLTVASIRGREATIALIPFTLQHTTLGQARAGVRLNLEYDILAKYVEALLQSGKHGEEDKEQD